MCKHPRLQRRVAVYWFRCRIPADLVDDYGNQEILESLRTRDAKEARRPVRSRSEAQEQNDGTTRQIRGLLGLLHEFR